MVVSAAPRAVSVLRARAVAAPLAIWAALVAVGTITVSLLPVSAKGIHFDAGPLVGRIDWRPNPRLLLPLAVAAAIVLAGPAVA
ncbi:MAG TPA: hypothetical protein VF152_08035, partial [Acidimicrobiia bacterium]